MCLKLLVQANVAAALRLPSPSVGTGQQLGRRAFATAALGSLLAPNAAHAGFATNVEDISEERLAVLAKNRQNFGEQAYKIVCDRDDEKCLADKREMANPAKLLKVSTDEERKQSIQDQANSCRGMCSRPDIRMRCERGDEACLAEKQRLKDEAGVGSPSEAGAALLPYVGGVVVAVIGVTATAPEKTSNPKGMQIRENFYKKRKEDTEIAKDLGLTAVNAAQAPQIAKERKKRQEAEEAKKKE